jgi:hypothetical protein
MKPLWRFRDVLVAARVGDVPSLFDSCGVAERIRQPSESPVTEIGKIVSDRRTSSQWKEDGVIGDCLSPCRAYASALLLTLEQEGLMSREAMLTSSREVWNITQTRQDTTLIAEN